MRVPTGIAEFDRVLGGGLTAGKQILFAGPEGVGKTTLLLQVANGFSRNGRRAHFASRGSAESLRALAAKCGISNECISYYGIPDEGVDVLDFLENAWENKVELVVLDTFLDVYVSDPGLSVSEVRPLATPGFNLRPMADNVANVANAYARPNTSTILTWHHTDKEMLGTYALTTHIADGIVRMRAVAGGLRELSLEGTLYQLPVERRGVTARIRLTERGFRPVELVE